MNAFQLSSTQTFRQGFTVEPIGLHPLSWSSGDHRWSGDQAPIPLSRKPIIQPVPCGSSLIGKGHLLIRKVVVYMVQQVLHFIRHAQGSDESLMTAKSCRDALFVHVQAGKHIILSGDKRLVSHRSASFGQCLLFQALYQSTRIENRHPSYKSQTGIDDPPVIVKILSHLGCRPAARRVRRRVESIYSKRSEEPKAACQRKPTAPLALSSTETSIRNLSLASDCSPAKRTGTTVDFSSSRKGIDNSAGAAI